MSGEEESSVCFACLKQFHPAKSSSSSVLAGSLLFTKFISLARQYLRVDASVSNLSPDQDDLDLCHVCSRRVASICQLHNELQVLEHCLSTKLEELAALMKQSKNGNQNALLSASRTNALFNLRDEIVFKCFEKCELLMKNRECHENERPDEDDEAERMELDIKSEVESLQEESEDGANLDDDNVEEKEEFEDHSLGQTIETENEDKDEREEDSSSDHSFIPSSGDRDSSSSSDSDCSNKGRSYSPQKVQANPKHQPTKQKRTVAKKTRKPTKRPCKICGAVIEEPRRTHMKMHQQQTSLEPLVCELCGASVTGRNAFYQHMHYYHRRSTWICDVCGKPFGTKGNLERHQTVHTGEKNFKCHLCPAQFTNNNNLKEHLVRTHGKDKGQEKTPGEGVLKIKCEYPSCSASFLSESELTSHIEQVHSFSEESMCKLCGKVLANKQGLASHGLVHNQVKKHICTVCKKAFPRPNSLRKHLKEIHGQLKEHVPCTQPGCDKKFSCASYLHKHLKRKHRIFTAKQKGMQTEKKSSSS